MPYNETLANRVREKLMHLSNVEEKLMFNGLTFMVDGKMCIGVKQDELMVRLNPDEADTAAEKNGCRQMVHGGKVMKGYIFVAIEELQREQELAFWIDLALAYNPLAKASKKK